MPLVNKIISLTIHITGRIIFPALKILCLFFFFSKSFFPYPPHLYYIIRAYFSTILLFKIHNLFQFLRFTLITWTASFPQNPSTLSFSKYFLHRSSPSPFTPNVTKPTPLTKIHQPPPIPTFHASSKKRPFQSHLFEPQPYARHTCHDTYFLPSSPLPPSLQLVHPSTFQTHVHPLAWAKG